MSGQMSDIGGGQGAQSGGGRSGFQINRQRTYLDYNASAPLRRGARVAMTSAFALPGNASSVHEEGRTARGVIEHARDLVAGLLGASATEVVFTSGGTEANVWVLGAPWDAVFVADIEHESVLEPARQAAGLSKGARAVSGQGQAELVPLSVDSAGIITAQTVRTAIADYLERQEQGSQTGSKPGSGGQNAAKRPPRLLLSVQMANNETGIIQPLGQVIETAHEFGVHVHCDGVQAAGRLAISFADLGLDFMTISGHKIGGPKGIGALLIKDGHDLQRLIVGGGQERQWRAGTENVAAIAGFGSAADAAVREIAAMPRLQALRDTLEQGVLSITPQAQFIGADVARLANTSCVALGGQSAETLVIKLDLKGIAVSAGSACSSGKVGASHVLAAMGLADELARSAIRVSMGWGTSSDDVEAFKLAWQQIMSGHNAGQNAMA